MFPSLSTLALPLLLLSAPFASASSSHGVNPIKRSHSRRAVEQKRDAELLARNATTPAQAHLLDKRQSFHGRGTYYYVDVGPGACGNWGNNADYTVALNSAQYCCGCEWSRLTMSALRADADADANAQTPARTASRPSRSLPTA
jgi:hypothetical protein